MIAERRRLEYFHGDTGAGVGASHQTGWTGLVANPIQGLGWLDAERVLEDVCRTALVYHPDSGPT